MLLRTSLAVAVLAFPFGTVYTTVACDVRALLNEGSHLMADQVVALEAHPEEDPSDMSARARSLGYYSEISRCDESHIRVRWRALVLWLIQNEQKSQLLGALDPDIRNLDSCVEPVGYRKGKKAYLAHLEEDSNDLNLLEHAAEFMVLKIGILPLICPLELNSPIDQIQILESL